MANCDTTQKSGVWRSIARFAPAYLFSYFLQTLYGMADLFIIGRYGGAADTTAVAVGSQVMHMLTVMLVGLAMGTTVLIARAAGAKNDAAMRRAAGNTFTLFGILAIALTALLLCLVVPIVRLVSTPREAAAGAQAYLRICFAGVPFITAYNVIAAVYRGMGDSKTPLIFVAVACAFNIALDYLFMGAFQMGPAGAALGTTLSQAASVAFSIFAIKRRKETICTRADLRVDRAVIGNLLRIGAPVALQDGLIQVAFLTVTVIANRRGLTDAAAVGVVEKVMGFMFLVPSTMLSTVSALGARELGARRENGAKRVLFSCIALGASIALCASIIVQFSADGIVSLFTPDAAAIRAGGQYLRGYIWDCLFGVIQFSFSGYFCARGRSRLSFYHNIASIALVRIPGAALASAKFPNTLLPMGMASSCGSLASSLICVGMYLYLNRKDKDELKTA